MTIETLYSKITQIANEDHTRNLLDEESYTLTNGERIKDISRNDDGSYYVWTTYTTYTVDGNKLVI